MSILYRQQIISRIAAGSRSKSGTKSRATWWSLSGSYGDSGLVSYSGVDTRKNPRYCSWSRSWSRVRIKSTERSC